MDRKTLVQSIRDKESYLCVGLDTDPRLIPTCLRQQEDPVFAFNKAIIDATKAYCVSYKINTAFYEAAGLAGWKSLEKTVDYIPSTHFSIADAKRGDIGNTSSQYARAFFETMAFDSITVAPYMGEDSVRPFLGYNGKWAIVLALTSNEGARDFERLDTGGEYLYEKVLKTVSRWGTEENLMFVVGATQAAAFGKIREICPDHFFLVPGVGAQGGSLRDISEIGLNADGGLLVNSSRAIIYASSGEDFAEAAAKAAKSNQEEMRSLLRSFGQKPARIEPNAKTSL